MKFGLLSLNDVFKVNHIYYIVIPIIKNGCCSHDCNARNIDTNECIYISPFAEIEKIDVYQTHEKNYEYVRRIVNEDSVIIIENKLPIYGTEALTLPIDRFVEFEQSDTWLWYFKLSKRYVTRYYERFIGHWEPRQL